jgi:hypothetical protein
MEEAIELANYLPISFKTPKEQEYIEFLWDAFETNYIHDKYQFAFLAYHMLTMSFVYFNIWQIRQTDPDDFAKAIIGFNKELEKELVEATSPFTFWRVNESSVMRFLKLIGCKNDKIGTYAALDAKIREILRVVDEIQTHSIATIQRCYARFLEESNNPDDREYSEDADQIREVLIHAHYLSQKDIEICAAYDWQAHEELEMHTNAPGIESLHQTLCATYAEPEAAAAP